jgi:hypothetical protein
MEEFPQKKDCSFIYALCHIKFSNTLDGKMTFLDFSIELLLSHIF